MSGAERLGTLRQCQEAHQSIGVLISQPQLPGDCADPFSSSCPPRANLPREKLRAAAAAAGFNYSRQEINIQIAFFLLKGQFNIFLQMCVSSPQSVAGGIPLLISVFKIQGGRETSRSVRTPEVEKCTPLLHSANTQSNNTN